MRIILVATDVSRKNIAFVSDTGQALSLEETIRLIQAQTLKGAYVVRGKYGPHIRSLPNSALKDNLDTLSVSGRDIISYINQTKHAVSTPPISQYLERYLASLDEGESFITPNDKKLPFSGILSNLKREYLYKYLIQPKHNIRFAAAFVRSLINNWAKEIDLSRRPEITVTLYHLPYRKPHSKPVADERGNQVAVEFYGQAKKWLT